jgi:AraC-like DNA-binding protein
MKILSSPGEKDNVGVSAPIPLALSKYVYPFTTVEFRKSTSGNFLFQKMEMEDFSLFFFRFDVIEKVTLFALAEKAFIGLTFRIRGSIFCTFPGDVRRKLEESYCEMFYSPAIESEFTLVKGLYESCWLVLKPGFISEMADRFDNIKLLCKMLAEERAMAQPSLKVMFNAEIKTGLHEMRTIRQLIPPEKRRILLYSCIYKLLTAYEEGISNLVHIASISTSGYEEKLLKIYHFISANPNIHDCSLDQLAAKFQIQKNGLKVNFKKKFGIPLSQYVHSKCMERAKILLSLNVDSVTAIAYELGYGNKSNFINAFKKYYNCLPHQMRTKGFGEGALIIFIFIRNPTDTFLISYLIPVILFCILYLCSRYLLPYSLKKLTSVGRAMLLNRQIGKT